MTPETQQDLVVSARVVIPAAVLNWSFARSSGPGGQNVNKVNSKAILRWNVFETTDVPPEMRARFLARYASRITTAGDLIVESEEFRDQPQNVHRCLEKLREMLVSVLQPPKKRKPTKRTAGSQRRRLADKKARADMKQARRPPAMD